MVDETPYDDEALRAYVNGRSTAEEAAVIESAAEQNERLAAEIALLRGIRDALARETAEQAPGDLGWARLSRAMEKDADLAMPTTGWNAARWKVAAVAAVAAVALWQVAAVPFLPGSQGRYVPVSETPADAPTITVAFVSETTEAEIRALLAEAGGHVTGGPSAIGLWRIGFDSPEERDTALALFAARPDMIESAQAD